jgi:hypothetical protein
VFVGERRIYRKTPRFYSNCGTPKSIVEAA